MSAELVTMPRVRLQELLALESRALAAEPQVDEVREMFRRYRTQADKLSRPGYLIEQYTRRGR